MTHIVCAARVSVSIQLHMCIHTITYMYAAHTYVAAHMYVQLLHKRRADRSGCAVSSLPAATLFIANKPYEAIANTLRLDHPLVHRAVRWSNISTI